jgi:LicD family protein
MQDVPQPGPSWIAELLYRTLAAVDQLLLSAGVPYSANGGTLLGAMRHEGLIPWDVDGDIAVRHADLPRILEHAGSLRAEGFDMLRRSNDIVKVFALEGRLTGAGWRYPALDIWPMVMVDDRWAPSDDDTRLYWREWLEPQSFATTVRRPFGAGHISTVTDEIADRYLTRTYGPNWRTEYVDYESGLPDPFHPRRASGGDRSPRQMRRADGLELHEIDDGLIVYQQDPPRVHHLNHTAALVFALCTGELTIDEIVGHVKRGYRLELAPVAEVNACVERLCKEQVLVVG